MTSRSNLQNLLLKPQATEVSYSYIESLVVDRVNSHELFTNSNKDSSVDLIDILSYVLHRAGSGWVMVVAKRLSKGVVLGILTRVSIITPQSDLVLGSLDRLISSYPVLIKCHFDQIVSQISRIIKLNPLPTPNFFDIIKSVLSVKLPSNTIIHSICSLTLSNLAVSTTGFEASSCLEVLVQISEFISRDSQLTNTALGLSNNALSQFGDNIGLRRLVADLANMLVNSKAEVAQSKQVKAVEQIETVEQPLERDQESPEESNESEVVDVDISSPRSSCPSL